MYLTWKQPYRVVEILERALKALKPPVTFLRMPQIFRGIFGTIQNPQWALNFFLKALQLSQGLLETKAMFSIGVDQDGCFRADTIY